MTSRLKRKLNDLGVDPSSSKANESFCLIGTPLPPLEKSKDTGEFVPLWKQEVRDEKGRRRLHGAFTGGFSAGYFNSVGSKEGWAPSTFVSSRSERAQAKAARPEDFMDEEDLAELQDSRKLVDENEEMDFGGTEAELRRRGGAGADIGVEKDPITEALEASLAPAPKDSVGARILKKMGWRVGQGIGPRLTYAQRKAQDNGFLEPSKETTGDGEDEEAKKHLYPRRDTPVLLASRKDNFHGLGYIPGMRLEESIGSGRDARGQGPNLAAGFGLGALNDADEDDLDVYDTGMGRRGRSRMAYDVTDEESAQDITMGTSSRRHPVVGQASRMMATTVTQTFSDGRPVLKGFVLSDRPVAEDRWFPLPEIPPGWKPNPRRVWDEEKNKENVDDSRLGQVPVAKPTTKTHAEWKDSFMSADERGSMLGETPLPSKPRSVFEYISQKDRERLQNIKNAVPIPSTLTATSTASPPSNSPPPTHRVRGELHIPYLHPSVAKAALQGFQPFTRDPVKQSRYAAFLHYQSNRDSVAPGAQNKADIGFGPLPGQSVDEFSKELEDYAKAATVFKPLSGAMAGRFRSAVVVENGPTVIEGLHQPTSFDTNEDDQKDAPEEKKEEDPKMSAVRLGMYGPLTRDVLPWQPARLLCKRFGVKDPEVDAAGAGAASGAASDIVPTAAAKESSQRDAGLGDPSDSTSGAPGFVSAGAITDGSSRTGGRSGPRNIANVGLGEDEDQGRDTLTYQRPSMDIFKAIFASDDEDSGDEDEDGENAAKDEPIEDHTVGMGAKTGIEVKTESIPSHLAVGDAAPPSYEPKQDGPATNSMVSEKVDLASFKPTFVPRSDRESRKDKSKDKKEKDKKKKSSGKAALMSFDLEDGFGPNLGAPTPRKEKERDKDKDKERKKKKRKERQEEDVDDSMWVEAPPPEVVKSIAVQPPSAIEPPPAPPADTQANTIAGETGQPRGRKRAIDFM